MGKGGKHGKQLKYKWTRCVGKSGEMFMCKLNKQANQIILTWIIDRREMGTLCLSGIVQRDQLL